MSKPIKVMIVDDSAVVRMVLSELLATDKEIEVIATASDPLFALDKMKRQWPDVIVLDIEMPRMDGITFLSKLMAEHPTPVIICSTLTVKGADTTMQALAAGAVSVVSKPTIGLKQYLQDESDNLITVVKAAAKANISILSKPHLSKLHLSNPTPHLTVLPKLTADDVLPTTSKAVFQTTERIVAIGASTGGVQALERVLTVLPKEAPGILVVQHMPEKFTEAFAKRLNSLCQIEVKEAVTGDRVTPGRALIAQGGRHMVLKHSPQKNSAAQYHVEVINGPPVSRHCPSVDVLFRSVAQCAGKNALGIIMTGMGDDGARGLKEMLATGAHTLGQDEATCVVYGMPAVAKRLGAVEHEVPLHSIPAKIIAFGNA